MLMSDNKKKSIGVILAKIGKPGTESSEPKDGAEQDASMPKETAAEELLAAIESKSAKGIVEAFESLMELCASEESEPSEEPTAE